MSLSIETLIEDPSIEFAQQRFLVDQLHDVDLREHPEVFEKGEEVCTCIDEGTPGDFRLAGAGILEPGGFDSVVEMLRKAGVKKVESHANCGAVNAAAKDQLGSDATPEEIENFGKAWAEKVANALGVEHTHRAELDRPMEAHDANVIYVDLEGGFHSERLPGELPKGFGITAKGVDASSVARQVRLAVDITLGDKGKYRDYFNRENPLPIILVGDPDASPVRHELVEAIHSACEDLGARVKIDSLPVHR